MRAPLVLIALSLVTLPGCEAPASLKRSEPIPKVHKPRTDASAALVGRTLIYPCRWGRAVDLAATLEPLLLNRHGPGVRVVPQVQSNSLFIYLPSHREQELDRSRRSGRGAILVR